ncbi:palmitoyltransferase ZDHHC19-like [Ictidomys tridecemlineatus]
MGHSGLPQTRTESGSVFSCRALAQSGEWALPVATGILCLLSFYSLICMNISDPGILHRGSVEQKPEASYVAHLNNKSFPMPWCAKCHLHRPPRTHHCETCNICVEEFDHHCRWVNNCVGHRNIRLYMLLLLSLCLYLGAVLASCVVFLVHRSNIPFMDRALTIIVAVPSASLLVRLILQLLIKASAVSTARRPYETQVRGPNVFTLIPSWPPLPLGTISAFSTALGPDGAPESFLTHILRCSPDVSSPWSWVVMLPPGRIALKAYCELGCVLFDGWV